MCLCVGGWVGGGGTGTSACLRLPVCDVAFRSDKTGTLTLNKLAVRDPICMSSMDGPELIFYAALASRRFKGSQVRGGVSARCTGAQAPCVT